MPRSRFRLRTLAVVVAVLAAGRAALTLALLLPVAHRALRAGLERTIGRPVEVSRFDFSFWNGPRLQAFYVTVGEDPEFGSEFLLRADRLEAGPDWPALLRGRLVLSRLWLQRPSLNLVLAPSGRWNYQVWAAARGVWAPGSGAASLAPFRLEGLSVSDGRINFKRGPDKLSFALVNVNGSIAADSAGSWQIALRAQPFRAGVTLQDAGEFRLQGQFPVSGASAGSPPPVELSAQWQRASLPDALRLILGRDFGVRGRMESAITFRAPHPLTVSQGEGEAPSADTRAPAAHSRISDPWWSVSGVLRLAEVHRWDLSLGPGLPALNLSVDGVGSADRRLWEFTNIHLDAPRSNLRGQAFFDRADRSRASLRLVTASIRLDDLLAWYRAFHPGVDPGTALEGYAGADVELQSWPPSVVRAALVTTGARLTLPRAGGNLVLHRAVLEADRSGARLNETTLGLESGDEPGIRISARMNWAPGLPFSARLTGSTEHVAALSTASAALGLSSPARPLQVAGSASLRLNFSGSARPWQVSTTGTLSLQDARFSGGLLRSQLTVGKARLDLLPDRRRLQISAATAFGGTWSGTLEAPSFAGPWEFRLAVDHWNPVLLLRGFSSQALEDSSLLARILPAQAAATVAREEPPWPGWLRGEGAISAGTLAVGRLEFERLKGHLSISQRVLELEAAEATLAGGRVRGEARADFGEVPRYAVRAEFDGINVAALAALTVSSRQCCTGTGSGQLELDASGWNRDALLASLKGKGNARVRSSALLTLDLPDSLAGRKVVPGHTALGEISGEFSFANRHAWLDHLLLELPAGRVEATGNVDFHGQLDVRLSATLADSKAQSSRTPRIQLQGTLASPQLVPAANTSP